MECTKRTRLLIMIRCSCYVSTHLLQTLNENSSRFGKFLEVFYNDAQQVTGARLSNYLLEKSRVTSQAPGERNFHVFYYLLAGMPAAA